MTERGPGGCPGLHTVTDQNRPQGNYFRRQNRAPPTLMQDIKRGQAGWLVQHACGDPRQQSKGMQEQFHRIHTFAA